MTGPKKIHQSNNVHLRRYDWKTRDISPKWWFVKNNQISLVGGFNPPGNMLVKIGSFLKVFSVQKTYLKPPLSSFLQSSFSNLTLRTWNIWNVGPRHVENMHPFMFWSPQTNPSCLMSVSRVSPIFLKAHSHIVRGSMGRTASLSTWMFDFFMVNSQQNQGQALWTTKYPERRSWFASQKKSLKKNSYTREFTNMTSWKITISNRTYMTYIFKEGGGCSSQSC